MVDNTSNELHVTWYVPVSFSFELFYQMSMTILGVFGGPGIAVFTLGMFVPFLTRIAALTGFCFGEGMELSLRLE